MFWAFSSERNHGNTVGHLKFSKPVEINLFQPSKYIFFYFYLFRLIGCIYNNTLTHNKRRDGFPFSDLKKQQLYFNLNLQP